MKKIQIAILFIATMFSFTALAQPGVAVGSGSGQAGTSVVIPLTFTGDGVAVGIQMDITYDNTALTPDLSACGTAGGSTVHSTVTCQVVGTVPTQAVRILGFSIPTAVSASGSLGTISFAITGGTAPQIFPIGVANEAYSGSAPDGSSTAGQVEVVLGPQPDYSSAPVGGTTLALNGTIGTNPTSDVVITNAGTAGAPNLTGTCALSGADAASFSITTAAAINIAQGANQTMTVDCDATAATVATLNASLDCTHNGDGTTEASPVSYPLTCDIAAISPAYNSTPAGGTAIAMGSILQGGTNPTASIDIDNDAGDATTTLTGTCTAPAPFIVTNGAFSVLQGAAADTVDIACDATAAVGAYAEDLTCTHNGANVASPVTYPMTCEVLAAAATGDQNPVNGTALTVVVAPSGSGTTSVTFSEIGGQGVDITDLTCSITPGVGFTVPAMFPATVPAAGSLPVVVTFTDPGDGSATAGSLDCTYTDGTGAVAVSYPLNFVIRAVNVPTLSMMGYLVLTLGFGLIGFFAFRRRA
jgi:hypothetical protein